MDYRMNATSAQTTSRLRGLRLAALALAALAAGSASCTDPDIFLPPLQAGGPKGILSGAITYAGPLPCTEAQHIVGAAILLVFDNRLLPPPEGLGTTATSLGVVSGDKLFAGVRTRLKFELTGKRWCPPASAPPVTVSADWAVGPLDAAFYQVRGFYDLDGNFDPGFKIANLPTKGDVGGGAIDNAADVLAGAAPIYRNIGLGVVQKDGTIKIPDTGSHVGGIAVTLGLTLPLERPIFYAKGVLDETPVKNKDPLNVKMPSDFQLATFSTFSPAATEASLIRITLGAGVPPEEIDAAAASPFGLPVKGATPATIFYSRQDVNGDGVINAVDHVPDSEQIPSLFPLSIFAKLTDGDDLNNQPNPAVVIQALTIYHSLTETAFAPANLGKAEPEAITAIRPAALCIDPADTKKDGVFVISHQTDQAMNTIIPDEAALTTALEAQFHRKISIVYGCLPEGRYGVNLIYGTGQAWSVPNEAGICAGNEIASADKKSCSDGTAAGAPHRARLNSQTGVLTITPPGDAAYCKMHPVPAACLVAK
ncbi:MAG: hypothetical protein ABJE95_20630 [Byssovorax sp.]